MTEDEALKWRGIGSGVALFLAMFVNLATEGRNGTIASVVILTVGILGVNIALRVLRRRRDDR